MATYTYKNKGVKLSTTNQTTIYTCPSSTAAIINSIQIANSDTAADYTATVEWNDNSAATTYLLLKSGLIPKQAALEALDAPKVLEASDILYVTASTANKLEVTLAIQEIT